MRVRKVLQSLVSLALFGIANCTLLVDTSDVDRGCPGQKLCGTGHCVDWSDPAYGCTLDHCEPCSLTNAIPACDGQTCVVRACLLGFGCPNETGCHANIFSEPNNCGGCGITCDPGQSCSNGRCVDG